MSRNKSGSGARRRARKRMIANSEYVPHHPIRQQQHRVSFSSPESRTILSATSHDSISSVVSAMPNDGHLRTSATPLTPRSSDVSDGTSQTSRDGSSRTSMTCDISAKPLHPPVPTSNPHGVMLATNDDGSTDSPRTRMRQRCHLLAKRTLYTAAVQRPPTSVSGRAPHARDSTYSETDKRTRRRTYTAVPPLRRRDNLLNMSSLFDETTMEAVRQYHLDRALKIVTDEQAAILPSTVTPAVGGDTCKFRNDHQKTRQTPPPFVIRRGRPLRTHGGRQSLQFQGALLGQRQVPQIGRGCGTDRTSPVNFERIGRARHSANLDRLHSHGHKMRRSPSMGSDIFERSFDSLADPPTTSKAEISELTPRLTGTPNVEKPRCRKRMSDVSASMTEISLVGSYAEQFPGLQSENSSFGAVDMRSQHTITDRLMTAPPPTPPCTPGKRPPHASPSLPAWGPKPRRIEDSLSWELLSNALDSPVGKSQMHESEQWMQWRPRYFYHYDQFVEASNARNSSDGKVFVVDPINEDGFDVEHRVIHERRQRCQKRLTELSRLLGKAGRLRGAHDVRERQLKERVSRYEATIRGLESVEVIAKTDYDKRYEETIRHRCYPHFEYSKEELSGVAKNFKNLLSHIRHEKMIDDFVKQRKRWVEDGSYGLKDEKRFVSEMDFLKGRGKRLILNKMLEYDERHDFEQVSDCHLEIPEARLCDVRGMLSVMNNELKDTRLALSELPDVMEGVSDSLDERVWQKDLELEKAELQRLHAMQRKLQMGFSCKFRLWCDKQGVSLDEVPQSTKRYTFGDFLPPADTDVKGEKNEQELCTMFMQCWDQGRCGLGKQRHQQWSGLGKQGAAVLIQELAEESVEHKYSDLPAMEEKPSARVNGAEGGPDRQ